MNNNKSITSPILKTLALSVLVLTTQPANAAMKFRLGFEADTRSYAVYMTPDSTPSRDLLISAQVTLVVPHNEQNTFTVDNINSDIEGANWTAHSRVDAPEENSDADYISLGYSFSGSKPPSFNWVVGEEQKILSFSSQTGCDAQVKLINNSDPFSQLPNSANTNPGNDFMNVGWLMSNAYTGNYGGSVSCAPVIKPPVACEYNGNDTYYLGRIERLEALRVGLPEAMQERFDRAIDNLKSKLSCQK